jgi:hypothetical protein
MPFSGASRPERSRMIDQDPSPHLRRHAEQVRA